MGRVLDVNVVHTIRPGYFQDTAIDKRPVSHPVEVTAEGLVGDQQRNRSHGGPDQAVYAYAAEDAGYWAGELGRDLPSGMFGENLTTAGVDVGGALIGEVWRIGDPASGALLEVRMPRTPCENLSAWIGLDRFHLVFARSGRVGAMLKVLEPGSITAGDRIRLEYQPSHGVTVAALATGPDVEQMQRLLDADLALARSVRAKARRMVARAARVQSGAQQNP